MTALRPPIWLLSALFALAAGGCFDPQLGPAGGYRCTGPQDCPADFECFPGSSGQNVCMAKGLKKDLGKKKDGPNKQDLGKKIDANKTPDLGKKKDMGKTPDKTTPPDKKWPPDTFAAMDFYKKMDAAPVCNNDKLEPGEECDKSKFGGKLCQHKGYTGGFLTCTSGCKISVAKCTKCNNGVLEPGEQCDKTQLGGKTCGSYGYTSGAVTCTSGCKWNSTACYTCSDGKATGKESCDKIDLKNQTCATVSSKYTGGDLACDKYCSFDTALCYGLSSSLKAATLLTSSNVQPRLVWNGAYKTGLVVWDDAYSSMWNTRDIRAQVLSATYNPNLTTPENLTKSSTYQHREPDLALLGKEQVMVYTDTSSGKANIYAARVTTSGKINGTDKGGIRLDKQAVNQSEPAIACSAKASNCLVVWSDARKDGINKKLYGAILKVSLKYLKVIKLFTVSSSANKHDHPSVASDGTHYVVAWHYKYSAGDYIQSKWVTNAGYPSASTYAVSPTDTSVTARPRIAHTGGSYYLVVWEDNRNKNSDIYGSRLSGTGSPITADWKSGFPIAASTKAETYPDLDCDKGGCVVAYVNAPSTLANQILLKRATFSGSTYKILDSSGILVGSAPFSVKSPAVALDPNAGKFVLIWVYNNPLYKTYRVYTRAFTP